MHCFEQNLRTFTQLTFGKSLPQRSQTNERGVISLRFPTGITILLQETIIPILFN
jgi:hypothetical protein